MRYDYGLWPIVIINVGFALAFAFSFLRPRQKREWRSLGVLSAFVVALFAEMYGFPLTIYLLAAALGRLPGTQPFAHENGNLWASLFLGPGWGEMFMLVGGLLIFGGAWIVASAWRRIHTSEGELVTEGPYAVVRHPQYAGLILSIVGALVQWPTLITLAMAPVLVFVYRTLATREDSELEARFGDTYRQYRERVPAFVPASVAFWNRQRQAQLGEPGRS